MLPILFNKKALLALAAGLVMFSQMVFAGWEATPTKTSTNSPYLTLGSDAQRGRWLWLKNNCAGCHGDRATGGMGPNIQFKETKNVQDAVTGGTSAMPLYPTGSITSTDITLLTTYLNSFGKPGEPMFICWAYNPIPDIGYNDPKGQAPRPNCK